MRVIDRAQKRLALIIAAVQHDRALGHELAQEFVAVLEARGRHASGRPHGVGSLFGKRDDERPVFTAEKAGGVKRLQFLSLADIEPLADVYEGRHRWVERTERAGDDRAEMRSGHGLRRRVAGMPLILMARVQNKA